MVSAPRVRPTPVRPEVAVPPGVPTTVSEADLLPALVGAKRTLMVRDILGREASKVSPMPIALLNLLTLEEVLDLLAYLESGGNPNHPGFGK